MQGKLFGCQTVLHAWQALTACDACMRLRGEGVASDVMCIAPCTGVARGIRQPAAPHASALMLPCARACCAFGLPVYPPPPPARAPARTCSSAISSFANSAISGSFPTSSLRYFSESASCFSVSL